MILPNSYELGNPDYLNSESFKPMVRMVYQQCLCCFYHNPEVWLSFAKFEEQLGSTTADHSAVRSILLQAIDAIPDSAVLRSRLGELEEHLSNVNAAGEVYRKMFEHFCDGLSFTLYQRFLHRNIGVIAARRLFSETWELRAHSPELSAQVSLFFFGVCEFLIYLV